MDTHNNELAKAFEPAAIEARWAPVWESRGYFAAGLDVTGPSFSIQLPPPNVTGILHMGHAFNHTVMDALTRYHRMRGFNTLWLPGTDHAGIATQIVVERQLEQAGIDRKALGRDKFVAQVWDWKETSGGAILGQMRRLGDSVDWSRTYFTMDEKLSRVVVETFVQLYEQGLIYRGQRLVNWDPKLQSAVSDLEVESEEEDGRLWEIRYPGADGGLGVVVATTRPETILGDVAVAVHPEDERYAALIGKRLTLPLTGREIPVIADDMVDREFGTGCVKITPAHDFNDFAVGQRHGLTPLPIFTVTATVNDNAPEKYRGLDRYLARKAGLEDLKAAGLLVAEKPHKMMVPRCGRHRPCPTRHTRPGSGAPTRAAARCTSPGCSPATAGTPCATARGRCSRHRTRMLPAPPAPATCRDGACPRAPACSSPRTTGRRASARPPRRCGRSAAPSSCAASRRPEGLAPSDPRARSCGQRSGPCRGTSPARCR